jgi:glutathione synthase/RimK-type ligase-like ATP-grasp enzyme
VSEPVAPPPLARALALQAAAAVRGDLVGVDLLPTRAAFVISEINGAVDFRPRYAIDFDDVYTDAVLQLLRVAHARRVAA